MRKVVVRISKHDPLFVFFVLFQGAGAILVGAILMFASWNGSAVLCLVPVLSHPARVSSLVLIGIQ